MAHADYSNATIGGLEVNGRLDCLSTPYAQAVAEGSIPNHDAFSKIAYNGTAGTAEVDIWSKTGLYAFPAAATAMFVSSTDNTNDKAAGSGAQEVKIIYLDANYALGTATVIPNGTALVSAGTFLRVNEVYVSAAGTLSKASGAISVTSAAGAATYGFITAGFTVARSSIYTVPAGKILNVTDLHGSWAHTSAQPEYGRITLRSTSFNQVRVPNIFYPVIEIFAENNTVDLHLESSAVIPEKCDVKVSCVASAAGVAGCVLRGWLEPV